VDRRSFLTTALAAALSRRGRAATKRIDRSRISAITDEIARSPAGAIEFAHEYGLQWLSLRDVPVELKAKKSSYYSLDPEAMAQAAREFKDGGIRIAFLDTGFLKYGLPGTEPKRKTPEDDAARARRQAREQTQFENRLNDLRQGIRASQVFECPMLRIFTFSRVAEPESLYPRIAEVIGEMAVIAGKEGIKLLIENEASQNAGTSAETAKLLKLLPANVGINWDSLNGLPLGEKPFPDGYNALHNDRVWSVHIKGKSLLDYPEHQDWPAIFSALERDGFQGRLELETHIFGEGQVAASHASMKEILRLLNTRQDSGTA
jgi:sugar phosphate isomerase/epimerase